MIRDIVWGAAVEGAQIAVTTPKPVFASGEIIPVTMLLKNVRDDVLRVVGLSPWQTYKLDLSFSDGRPAERTLFGKRILKDPSSDYRAILELEPGSVLVMTLQLNRLFDLTLAEEYELSATRSVELDDGSDFAGVVSNHIVVEVSDEVDQGYSPELTI